MSEGPIFCEKIPEDFFREGFDTIGCHQQRANLEKHPKIGPSYKKLRKLVFDLLRAADDGANYPEDPVEFERKMFAIEERLQQVLSDFMKNETRAD
jgi:hypothetical protein